MIKAILFDKDSTLVEFDSFWNSVCQKSLHEIMAQIYRAIL